MEILESLKTLVEDTVMSKMDNEQNLCGETVDGSSGVVCGDKVVVGSDDVIYGRIDNAEVGNQGLGVEGGGLSGGVGENCWGVGGMERGVLGNEGVADGSEGKECGLGPDIVGDVGAVQYGYQNGSGYELVQEVCLSDIGIEEVGADMLVMQEAATEEVGAEKVVIQEGIQEIGAEDVVMQEGIVDIEAGEVVMKEAIEVEEVGTKKVVVEEVFGMFGVEKLVTQEDVVGDEKVLLQGGNEENKAAKVLMQKAVEEVEIAKVVMQEGVNEQYISEQNLVDSGNKIDVSKSGISLYVDVFGQVDSGGQGDHSCMVEQGSFERSSNEDSLSQGIALFPDNETKDSTIKGNDVEGEAIACDRHRFSVGDLVWAKANTQLWWPGVIFEHSNLSNDTAKAEEDRFQVILFGSGNVLWGRTSQLKPFHDYFEQMSRQSNSKSFYCAVEKAVSEIGRRVKLEMTCPCYPEESKITDLGEGGGKFFKEACKLDGLPVLQFEPEKLLARIKCFAQDVTLPATIESKVIQNRLSAFYRSTGHLQLPIHQLKPTDAKSDDQNAVTSEVISSKKALKSRTRSSHRESENGKNEAICPAVSSKMKLPSPILSTKLPGNKVYSVERLDCRTNGKLEKSYESRERRKSKYLSFPYVDPSQVSKSWNNEEENEMAGYDVTSRSARTVKSCDRRTKKNPCTKRSGHDIYVPDFINASSAELLLKLRFTALDCLYPDESKQFDIMQSFVSRFREFAFRDFTHEVTKEEDTVCVDFENEVGLSKTLSEIEIHIEKQMEKEARERGSTKAATAALDISKIGLLEKDARIKSVPKNRKKEDTTPLGSNTKPTDGFPGNITTSGSIVIDFQTDPHASESQTVPIKRTRQAKKTPGFPEIKIMARLADLKGNITGAQLEGFSPASACTSSEGKSEPKRKIEATFVNYPMTNGADLPDDNGTSGILGAGLKEVEVMGPFSLQNISGLNKEGTKDPLSLHPNTELAPEQSDISKNTEPCSVMKVIQQTGILSPSDTPKLKKRKRKQKAANVTSAIPDLNGNTTETQLSEVTPQRKSRKKKIDAGLVDINLSSSEAQTNGEALGTALLLKFAPEAPMPTPEDLTSVFCIFGTLKDSEAKVYNESGTAQVVFINSSDARTAFCSLEKNSPFGPALVNYRLQVLFAASGVSGPDGGLNMHQVWPAEKVKNPPKPRTSKKPKNLGKPSATSDPQSKSTEAPDLQFVRQNLQMMTSMLENAGDNISPEMRVKLETEIKSLLNRVTSMVGSSS